MRPKKAFIPVGSGVIQLGAGEVGEADLDLGGQVWYMCAGRNPYVVSINLITLVHKKFFL